MRTGSTYRWIPRAILAATATLVALSTATATEVEQPAERVVAIGDIHGDFDGLLAILQASDLVDAEGLWIGDQATLVQLGDFTDRGSQVRQVMDYLRQLETAAADAGGRVIILLGNHEAMNLTGHFRDVTPEIYASFAEGDDKSLRREAWRQWVRVARRQASWKGERSDPPDEAVRREWSASRPVGYFEYLRALGPEGEYGRWLRTLPTVARVGETIFVHGGLSPEVARMQIPEINQAVASEFESFDRIRRLLDEFGIAVESSDMDELRASAAGAIEALQRNPQRFGSGPRRAMLDAALHEFVQMQDWLSYRPDGPLWFRGYATWDQEQGEQAIDQVLDFYGARRVVVGHTPPRPPSHIAQRFGNRVFLIDTGLLKDYYPGGRPSALELAGDRITAIYEGERILLVDAASNAEPATTAPHQKSGLQPGTDESLVAASPAGGEGLWMGADGRRLPFRNVDDLKRFLATADVVSWKSIPVGVTDPKKLLLEANGLRAHAVFRYHEEVKERVRVGSGAFHMFFKDSYSSEVAAFELARLLGLDTVPPATSRTLRRFGAGSIQLWIEDAMTELERQEQEIEPPDQTRFNRQMQNMVVFDNLVHNIDRNAGNIVIGPDWKIWYIDCTRCFARSHELYRPERIGSLDRKLWGALKALDWDEVRERLQPYVSTFELRALESRHAELVQIIQERIERLGEDAVLFTFGTASEADALAGDERASSGG